MSHLTRRRAIQGAGLAATALALPFTARTQKKSPRIGILIDMPGPYAEARRTEILQEAEGSWGLFKLLNTIPPDRAFKPLAESRCPLV